MFPAVALNDAVVAPAVTVTDAGTTISGFPLDSETAAPPAGAAFVRVTVQLVVAFELTLAGVQLNELTESGPVSDRVKLSDPPFRVAVTTAVWSEVKVPAVAVRVAVVAAAATVTDAGTLSAALLLERDTEAPPVGAAFDNVTVQVEVVLVFKLLGVQASELTTAGVGATRDRVAGCEVLLYVAVTVTL